MRHATPHVSLHPMSSALWDAWYARQRQGYVDQMVTMGGIRRADAEARLEQQEESLLPEGPETPSHHFLVAEVDGEPIGSLWLAERILGEAGPVVWVYSVEVELAARGRGYGRAIMLRAEQVARDLAQQRIALNVFADNEVAIALYASLGYHVIESDDTGQVMAKSL